jgi:hypothetical protein
VKHLDSETVKEIISRLEKQERNIDIAKNLNLSISTIEQINECKTHTNLHNYKYNIRKENKPINTYRKNVLNEYIEYEDYYELHIINTNNVEIFSKIDKDDFKKISQYRWTIAKHQNDIRVISLSQELNKQYLHQFVLGDSNHQYVIDHINRDPLDNRKNNLRFTTPSVNSTNAKPRTENKSGIRGVYRRNARPGIAKASWVCEWSENKKRHSKSFSIEKYGEEEAFRLASTLRERKMKEMKI